MRHSGGADLSFYCFLLEVAKTNISPHISAEVEKNTVNQTESVAIFCKSVMRLDLSGVGVPI